MLRRHAAPPSDMEGKLQLAQKGRKSFGIMMSATSMKVHLQLRPRPRGNSAPASTSSSHRAKLEKKKTTGTSRKKKKMRKKSHDDEKNTGDAADARENANAEPTARASPPSGKVQSPERKKSRRRVLKKKRRKKDISLPSVGARQSKRVLRKGDICITCGGRINAKRRCNLCFRQVIRRSKQEAELQHFLRDFEQKKSKKTINAMEAYNRQRHRMASQRHHEALLRMNGAHGALLPRNTRARRGWTEVTDDARRVIRASVAAAAVTTSEDDADAGPAWHSALTRMSQLHKEVDTSPLLRTSIALRRGKTQKRVRVSASWRQPPSSQRRQRRQRKSSRVSRTMRLPANLSLPETTTQRRHRLLGSQCGQRRLTIDEVVRRQAKLAADKDVDEDTAVVLRKAAEKRAKVARRRMDHILRRQEEEAD